MKPNQKSKRSLQVAAMYGTPQAMFSVMAAEVIPKILHRSIFVSIREEHRTSIYPCFVFAQNIKAMIPVKL